MHIVCNPQAIKRHLICDLVSFVITGNSWVFFRTIYMSRLYRATYCQC